MTKYATKTITPRAPIATTGAVAATYEGDLGFLREPKSELFILAVNFMGEDKNEFYESGDERQARFVSLIGQVTKMDPAWVQEFIYFLRHTAYMRTATVVALAEYVRAGGPDGKVLIGKVLRRADESAEILAYWTYKYGKPIPRAILKGVGEHLKKIDEYQGMKYAAQSSRFSLADAIELAHPKPQTPAQSELFSYLLDKRHHGDFRGNIELLPKIAKSLELQAIPENDRRAYLAANGAKALLDAGMTWERFSSWIPGGMDKAAWEAIIPSMGYMALLRNLRNFDEAKVSEKVAAEICAKLADPEQVAKSMQFPYRFYTAFLNVPSYRWAAALEKALDLSVSNIPELPGKTLVMVDVSGSMQGGYGSPRNEIAPYIKGAIFGVAQHIRTEGDLVAFGTDNAKVPLPGGTSVMAGIQAIEGIVRSSRLGHGTNTWQALERHYDGHRRVVIVTDMQSFGYGAKTDLLNRLEKSGVNLYNFNLAGYRVSNIETGSNGRYELGGLTDVTFRQIPLLEAGRNGAWPWEIDS